MKKNLISNVKEDKTIARLLLIFRIIIVAATAAFMAYHTQIFISKIEPNSMFAWVASVLIEAMIISLALMKTWGSRVSLVPLFFISVMAASASFVVKNEVILEQFIQNREAEAKNRQAVELLNRNLVQTQKELELGDRYTTKTLQRERQIEDRLEQVLAVKGPDGHLTLFNSLLFLVLVLVLQWVSVYTAMYLKNGFSHIPVSLSQGTETQPVSLETVETVRQGHENRRNGDNGDVEHLEMGNDKIAVLGADEIAKSEDNFYRNGTVDEVLKLKKQGFKPDDIARITGLSRATVYRFLKREGPQ